VATCAQCAFDQTEADDGQRTRGTGHHDVVIGEPFAEFIQTAVTLSVAGETR
jgi:hypothetical protein